MTTENTVTVGQTCNGSVPGVLSRNELSDPILSDLNTGQQEVAVHGDGPLLVLAVAGSGKTRAIAHRAAYLISVRGVPSSQILCLTFTNKAVGEMRDRISRLLGIRANGITVSTFHALGARWLRVHHRLIKRTGRFVIYDEDDQVRVAVEVAKTLGAEGSAAPLLADIEKLKNHGVLPGGDLAPLSDSPERYDPESAYFRLLQRAYKLYEDRLTRYDAMDFTDLLLKAIVLFERHPEILDRVRRRYRYILVDEYQDTCFLQEKLLRLLSAPTYNLCAVGDDDQSIYAFRHADPTGILTFEARYPGARVVRMEENYRSTGSIIDVARRVIAVNRRRKPKRIHTANHPGEPVDVAGFSSEDEEAAWIGQKIRELRSMGGRPARIAVLCRVASLFRPLERELTRAMIPYSLVDGLAFWDRREIKDMMAYLRLIHNPLDYLSFKRIANVPPRRIGKKILGLIERELKARPSATLSEILSEAAFHSPKLRGFLGLLEGFRNRDRTGTAEPAAGVGGLIETVIEKAGYEAYLVKHCRDAARRISNLMQLVSIARRFDRNDGGDLSGFLLQAGLCATGQEMEEHSPDTVRLMTIHAAKGLEFETVFLIGLEEGILPHARCRDSRDEERRLFYVAVTRARRRLFLSWSTRRVIQGREMNHPISSFVKETGCKDERPRRMEADGMKDEEPVIRSGGILQPEERMV